MVEMAAAFPPRLSMLRGCGQWVKFISLNRLEWVTAILLTLVILFLLVVRAEHAGALWRDECASVQLADMPTLSDIFHNFQRESFPPVFALALRSYIAICGSGDIAFRAFGVAIGAMMLVVIWLNASLLTNSPPLLSLLLLGLNASFLVWGTGIRGYGIGSVAVLLALGTIGKMLVQPSNTRIAVALLAALASVQLLLYNSVLLIAIAAGVMAVCLTRGTRKPLIAMAGIGSVCALSVLPYIGPFLHESESTVIFGGAVTLGWLWQQLRLALGTPVDVMTAIWLAIFFGLTTGAAVTLYRTKSERNSAERDLLLFGLLVSLATVVFYFVFLKIVSYRTRDWYYLALLAVLAGTIDLLAASLIRKTAFRVARLVLVIAAMIGIPFALWPRLIERQTNSDIVARKLGEIAQPRDLIVVNPWFYGIAFNWYYHGPTPWVTCPIISDHRMHRFDLLKAKMMSPNPMDDLQDRIGLTLKSGNRVWFAGGVILLPPGQAPIPLPPAPNSEFGWSIDAYAESWSQQLGFFLRKHALIGQFIAIPADQPVNELENVSLLVMDGWRE